MPEFPQQEPMFLIFVTIALVLLNGFFVAAEFAIVKVRHSQIEILAREGSNTARLSKNMLVHLDGYLAATQLGITLASLGLGWIGEPVVSKIILKTMDLFGLALDPETAHDIALPLAFLLITILHIVFGELAPKSLAITYPRQTTLLAAYPLRIFYVVFRPFIWLLNGIANMILRMVGIRSVAETEAHSTEELKYIVQMGQEHGMIEEGDYHIIKNAFEFSERTARQIMVPRTKVLGIPMDGFTEEDWEHIVREGYSRLPCYEGSIDNITGIVYLKDLLMQRLHGGKIDPRSLMRPAIFIPSRRKIGSLLKEFQLRHLQMAIVVNEFGGMEGLVTMEDILEELVGEIQDESDEEQLPVRALGNNCFEVRAQTTVHDINKYLPIPLEEQEDYETLAGFLMDRFGAIPPVGAETDLDDYVCTVMNASGHSIIEVRLCRKETANEEEQ